jgi:hypothetical protein
LAQVAEFRELPFPVVFLGDCIPEACHEDGWNQIVENTGERARAMVAAAATSKRRDVVLVAGPLSNYYCRVLKQAGEQAARELGSRLPSPSAGRSKPSTNAASAKNGLSRPVRLGVRHGMPHRGNHDKKPAWGQAPILILAIQGAVRARKADHQAGFQRELRKLGRASRHCGRPAALAAFDDDNNA